MTHHQYIQNEVIPMETPAVTPDTGTSSSSTSTSSISTNNSTSSTNSDSIVLNVHPTNKAIPNISRTQTHTNENISSNSTYNSIEISEQARRFAETRFPFPPFVINANRETFIILFDEQKWPTTIESMNYEKIIPKHLPPQFSIVLRNVPVDIEINSLLTNIKIDYPDVLNAFRITGINKKPSTLVRLDIQNISVIDKLLGKKFIYYENLRLGTTEYLAPAKVLVCTKCFEIGHFRSTCRSDLDHCRKCGVGVSDIKQHLEKCTNKLCCVRCQGLHDANDVRCPSIKSYRSILTKSLLSTAAAPVHQQNVRADFHLNDPDFLYRMEA
ncbi:unnamed protein product [Rotaria sp. Silwood1]|nr:unnamed protein product [Rotaria sp. Silwood1]CAF3703545.1 unnamed protein product [Rotaria sp. Silwood1]CAF4724684.1 unnamed protein product [Rotaria sp. Silwood1]CAF5008176.1 unnamed protein product [Rotaria sp. Silwood1]